jgi:hypothetical protein
MAVSHVMIPDFSAFRAFEILKTFEIRSFFLEKWLFSYIMIPDFSALRAFEILKTFEIRSFFLEK